MLETEIKYKPTEEEISAQIVEPNPLGLNGSKSGDAAYHREYRKRLKLDPVRAAHYRKVSRDRKARWRAVPGWRALHEPERRNRAENLPEIPTLHTGHELFDEAKKIVAHYSKPDTRLKVYDDLYEDLVSIAVVALVGGMNARSAVSHYLTRHHKPFRENNNTGSYKSWLALGLIEKIDA